MKQWTSDDGAGAPEEASELLAGRGPRMLLAEDDDAFRELLVEALEDEGYEVVPVRDGDELLDRLTESVVLPGAPRYDLVISDVRMPRRTGLEVLEQNYGRDPETRFLLITAFGDEAIHARASEFEVDVIDKPFDLDALLRRVRAIVEGWPHAR